MSNELVLTPGGYRLRSLVHRIEPGRILDTSDNRVRKLDLANRVVADLGQLKRRVSRAPLMPRNVMRLKEAIASVHGITRVQPRLSDLARRVPSLGSGWIVYASWTNASGTAISLFRTTWTVPPPPTTRSGQTIFLFNGILNSSMIYQPVLQWGPSAAGGGNFWSVASWYADGQGGPAFYSNLVRVNPGDQLVGVMTLTGNTGPQFSYNCEFQNIANTALPIQNVQELTFCIETLEAYNVSRASDYPASHQTAMTQIEIRVGNTNASVRWSPEKPVTDTGQHTVVVSNASPGGEVDLYYRQDPTLIAGCSGRLLIIDGDVLRRVNQRTGAVEQQGPQNDWPQPLYISALGNRVFVIDAGEGGRLWRVNPTTLVNDGVGPQNDWPQPRCMAAVGNRLFVIDAGEGGRLWRADPTTLVNDGVGPQNDWPQPRCMAAVGNRLFVIDAGQGGRLWRVDPTTLVNDGVGPENDWPQPLCMTAVGNELYVIDGGQGGRIWRVDVNTLRAQPVS